MEASELVHQVQADARAGTVHGVGAPRVCVEEQVAYVVGHAGSVVVDDDRDDVVTILGGHHQAASGGCVLETVAEQVVDDPFELGAVSPQHEVVVGKAQFEMMTLRGHEVDAPAHQRTHVDQAAARCQQSTGDPIGRNEITERRLRGRGFLAEPPEEIGTPLCGERTLGIVEQICHQSHARHRGTQVVCDRRDEGRPLSAGSGQPSQGVAEAVVEVVGLGDVEEGHHGVALACTRVDERRRVGDDPARRPVRAGESHQLLVSRRVVAKGSSRRKLLGG